MKKNIGKTDRALRVAIGIGIILAGMIFGSWWGLLGLIPLATSVVGLCPGYWPFSVSTCENKSSGGGTQAPGPA